MIAKYISKEKKAELEKELEFLKTDKRREILGILEAAKELGDLSENAEYHQAREEQAKTEDRINYIQNLLDNSVIVKKSKSGFVEIGSNVLIKKQDGSKDKYLIVGEEEADFSSGKISFTSPIGSALLGRKEGDFVLVKTPKGENKYEILKVE